GDGRYVVSYDPGFLKQSCRRLGGVIADRRIVSAVVSRRGAVLSGFRRGRSVYDRRLRSEAPPHFLEVPRPVLGADRVVTAPGARTNGGEASPLPLHRIPIGRIERDAVEASP
ncbi:MAG: hypothetical protein ACE5JG_09595, partial [Planctomycetota bacterium]